MDDRELPNWACPMNRLINRNNKIGSEYEGIGPHEWHPLPGAPIDINTILPPMPALDQPQQATRKVYIHHMYCIFCRRLGQVGQSVTLP